MVIGEAEIAVRPFTPLFKSQLEAETAPAFAAAGAKAEREGMVAGQKYSHGMKKGTASVSSALAAVGLPLGSYGAKLEKAAHEMAHLDQASKGFGATMAAWGGKAAAVGAGAVAAIGAVSVVAAVKGEEAATRIAANSNISEKAAQAIQSSFRDTAGTTIYSAKQIGEAYSTVGGVLGAIEGKALDVGQANKFMAASMDLAEGAGVELGAASGALAKTMQAYKLGVDKASEASDVLFSASRVTGLSVEQIAVGLGRVKGKLGDVAPSLSESAGLLNLLAKSGVTGRTAIAALSGSFNSLVGGSKATAETAKKLGVQIFDQQGHFVGLRKIIQQLHPILGRYNEQSQLAISKAFFGGSAYRQMLGIIRQGPGAFDRASKAAARQGAAHQAAEKQAKTFAHQIDLLKATALDLAEKFGALLIPKLQAVGKALASGVHWLTQHKEAAKALAAVITTILGAAIGAWVTGKAVAFVGSIKNMMAAAGKLAATMIGTATTVEAEGAAIVASADTTAAGVDTALGATGIGAILVGVGIASYELASNWSAAMKGLEEAAQAAANFIIDRLNEIISGVNEVIEKLTFGLAPAIGEIGQLSGAGGSAPSKMEEETARGGTTDKQLKAMGLGGLGNAHVTDHKSVIESAATRYGIDPRVLWGVYGTETNYGKDVKTSSAGAKGGFQFIKDTAGQYHYPYTNKQDPAIFAKQAESAAHYLSDLIKQNHGDVSAALAQYSGHTPGYAGKVTAGGQQFKAPSSGSKTSSHAQHVVHEASPASISKWAEAHVGKFAESMGSNRGPELDRLQGEFHTRAAAWCAEFATTAAMMGGANKAVRTASVATIRQWAAAGTHGYTRGLHHGDAKTGDLALFGDHHAGFVQSVNRRAGTFIDIEGNTSSGHVSRVTRKLSEADFARPAYKKVEAGGVALTQMSKGYEAAAKAAFARMTKDKKEGESTLTKMTTAIQSGNAKQILHVVDARHTAALHQLVARLHGDHTKATEQMVVKLVATHEKALKSLHVALLDLERKQVIERSEREDTIHTDEAHAAVEAISDATRVTLDRAAEIGKTGLDLAAAQAQTSLDAVKQGNDAAVNAAKIAVDRAVGKGEEAEAIAKHKLVAAENVAAVAEAQAQSTLELAQSAAQEAQAAASKATEEAEARKREEESKVTSTTAAPSFSFVIYGADQMTGAELMQEVGWAVKGGVLPPAVSHSPVPTGTPA